MFPSIIASRPMSALPPKADMCGAAIDVRFGPKADIEPVCSITSATRVVELLLQSFYVYHPTAFGPTAIIYMLSCSRGGMINAILTLCGPASFMRY
jgi:hypothetical protein